MNHEGGREADTGWMAEGRCRSLDPQLFFPDDGPGVLAAQAICASCPVREPCLDYALVNRIDQGVWGGTSQRERARIRARRRAASRT